MRVSIDHEGEEFPYEQLARHLRERIKDGTYAPGSKLPSLVDLAGESGLTTMTIRRSIRILTDEGLVLVRPGWGTFVKRPEGESTQ